MMKDGGEGGDVAIAVEGSAVCEEDRFIGNSVRHGETEEEGEKAGEEGHDEGLELEEGEGAKDEGTTRGSGVKFASVGLFIRWTEEKVRSDEIGGGGQRRPLQTYACRESSSETHLEVALEVGEHGDEDEELVYAFKDFPMGEMLEELASEDETLRKVGRRGFSSVGGYCQYWYERD
jgi:hypothetical protein